MDGAGDRSRSCRWSSGAERVNSLTPVAALRPLLEPAPSVTQGLNEGTDHRISTQRLK